MIWELVLDDPSVVRAAFALEDKAQLRDRDVRSARGYHTVD
jgi:hypothetical protein